jgi:hypothetical protein
MAVPDVLRKHAAELAREVGLAVEVIDGGSQIYVILKEVSLPERAYRVPCTDVLFVADQQYPLSAMDMFWTGLEVLLPVGGVPAGGDASRPMSAVSGGASRGTETASGRRRGTA